MVTVFTYVKHYCKEKGYKLFCMSIMLKLNKKNGLKLLPGRFQLDFRKNFLTVRIVKHQIVKHMT